MTFPALKTGLLCMLLVGAIPSLSSPDAWASGDTAEIDAVGYDVASNGLVISGVHLAADRQAPQVTIGDQAAKVVSYSPTLIVVEAPAGLAAGEYRVQVAPETGTTAGAATWLFSLATSGWSAEPTAVAQQARLGAVLASYRHAATRE